MRENTVRLGLMPPLTGLVGMYGAEIACDEVNESGGVLGRPLKLVIEDDGSLPESAVMAATKLVEYHRCAAIIGNLLSNSRIAVAYQVAEPHRIPYLNFSFYEGSILSRYFFHFAALPNQQIDRMIPYMRNQYGPRMFFAGHNYEWPRGSIDAAKRALEQSGGETVGEEYFPFGVADGDLELLLKQLAESGADVFVPYFAGDDQIRLLNRFSESGMKKKMAVVMGHYDEIMASRLSPKAREGFYSSNTYFMTLATPENKQYLKRLAGQPEVDGVWPQGNGILTNFGEGAYLCVKAFAKAANQSGSLASEALVQALETIEVGGPQGIVRMDPATHHAQVNTYLARCREDGSFAIAESFGAIAPKLPERYRHIQIGKWVGEEDIYLQSRMMAQITEAVLLVHATDGGIVYSNPGAEHLFGYDPGELEGKHFSVLFAPSDKTPREAAAVIGAILSKKGLWQGEMENITRDGKRFFCAASVSVFTHPKHGEVWMMVNKDITEHKQVEETLRLSEERFRKLIKVAPIPLAYVAKGGVIQDFNDRFAEVFGYTHEDIPTLEEWWPLAYPDESYRRRVLDTWNAEVQVATETGEDIRPVEYNVTCKNGEVRAMEISGVILGDDVLATFIDLTARKQAEERNRYLAAIVESSDDAIIGKTLDGVITSWNKGAERLYGYAAGEVLGRSVSLLMPPSRQDELPRLLETVREGRHVDHYESVRRKKDGQEIYVSLSIFPIADAGGAIIGGATVARDITQRLRAEEQLHAASMYARSLIEASPDPLVTISSEGKITDVNAATVQAIGVPRKMLIGSDFCDYFTEPDKARYAYQQVFAKGSVINYPLALRHVSGKITDVLYNAGVYRNVKGEVAGVFATARDVTERKRVEE